MTTTRWTRSLLQFAGAAALILMASGASHADGPAPPSPSFYVELTPFEIAAGADISALRDLSPPNPWEHRPSVHWPPRVLLEWHRDAGELIERDTVALTVDSGVEHTASIAGGALTLDARSNETGTSIRLALTFDVQDPGPAPPMRRRLSFVVAVPQGREFILPLGRDGAIVLASSVIDPARPHAHVVQSRKRRFARSERARLRAEAHAGRLSFSGRQGLLFDVHETLQEARCQRADGAGGDTCSTETRADPAATLHPEMRALRRFRNYYRLLDVGDYLHHVRVFYRAEGWKSARYHTDVDPGATPRHAGSASGIGALPPASRRPLPDSLSALGAAIERDVRSREYVIGDVVIHYLGTHRELRVMEVVVGDPAAMRREQTAYLGVMAADEDLTHLTGYARPIMASYPWNVLGEARSASKPRWIDAGLGGQGQPQLWRFSTGEHRFPEDGARFGAALLASARAQLDGAPGPALEGLAVQHDRSLLPEDLAVDRGVVFYVNACRVGRGCAQSLTRGTFRSGDAFAGGVHIALPLSVAADGEAVAFSAELAVTGPPIPPGTTGVIEHPVKLEFTVSGPAEDGATRTVSRRVETVARAIVDEGAVLILTLLEGMSTHRFDGVDASSYFEAHVGLSSL